MCMDVQDNEKMGDRSLDEEVQIIEEHIDKAGNKPVVKEERPDEAEIRELAAKMVEANKAKTVLAQQAVQQQRVQQLSGQANIQAYFNPTKPRADANAKKPNGGAAVAPAKANANSSDGVPAVDDESQRGRFGWSTFGDCHIPYILRSTEKYCAVRILESKLLNKYLSCLHPDIYNSTCIRSYYITEAESKLLNEINIKHCENQFGREQFTVHDLIVRLSDVREFYMFLDICYTKLTPGATPSIPAHNAEKCGFIRINKESVVPYTVKNGLKYVPLFYFEGETENLKLKAEKLEGWDLAYLKFCCKAQGIRNELFASETCSVISLADIKSYFPQGTNFEDYWPNKVIELVIANNKGSSGGWTKQPPKPPVNRQAPVNQNNVAANAINARAVQQHRANTINSTIQRAQAAQRPVPPTSHHPAHSAPSIVSAGRIGSAVGQPMINAVQAINGWSGLVGGQPTFSALVSQANQINRIPNSTLNIHNQLPTTTKSYTSVANRSRGGGGGTAAAYPVYPVSTMQNTTVHVQPPPLVRATAHSNQPNLGYSTYGKDDWVSATYTSPSLGVQNVVNASTYPQMLGLSAEQVQALMPQQSSAATLLPHSQRYTPPIHNAAAPHAAKYPPPLIPVVNNSTPANSSNSNNDTTNSRQTRQTKKGLIPIGDTLASSHKPPYQIQRALVEEKFVSCINFKPYVYNELLMTLPDFVSNYFPNCSVSNCREVLSDVLCIELYQGNRLQMEILQKAGKCQSVNEELPLIQVQSIMKYRRQLKYILENNRNMPMTQMHSEDHQAKKRQRIS